MDTSNIITCTKTIAGREVTLETGKVARQATASVIASSGDTQVLVTVVAGGQKPGQSFFPLTVNYIEKFYAAGKIPGSFFRREGRPSESEVLTSRLIDRPIRPLFPKGYTQEVQVVCTVMSIDSDDTADVISLIGVSAALQLSGLPFSGPLSAARVGFVDGNYVLNPGIQDLKNSQLDMVIAGSTDAVFMVESEASELTEDQMLGAILFAQQEMKPSLDLIEEMVSQATITPIEYELPEENEVLKKMVSDKASDLLKDAYQIAEKSKRQEAVAEARDLTKAGVDEDDEDALKEVSDHFKALESEIVRSRLLSGEPRIDGRDLDTVRPIAVETGILNQAHGSSLFTRGETQSIAVATVDSLKLSQLIDSLQGDSKDPFMLHYNFPPYSVGEAGMIGSPKRREIGHGKLARRALEAVIPNPEEFEYAIRVVSEITESNGSSSMATVCASSLAMMDAGIPIKKPVAGIAMGLVKDADKHCVITDILGDEDHLGDMDFKVAGTSDGVTALQMDIKIAGINEQILQDALEKANTARTHILGEMNKVLSESRPELNEKAPQSLKTSIPKNKIGEVIGKGGATIKKITEKTSTNIDINDRGQISIYGRSKEDREEALAIIESMTAEPEVGLICTGTVLKIVDFGAFVSFDNGKEGLVHVSEIAEERVKNVSDYLVEGEEVDIKVIGIDDRGKVKLSMKAVLAPSEE
ncbi:MAG: polyribonucleotide nucleotidyltransferase [Gammaproteobacteria bacterium]|jgi:polyribonucleotide nucleotidyltransferase|nr:MAG: polyribonucleotide nucleotidyltransferase [Gammaproteobacteria bacterium]